jgi:hypothetical protein
MFNPIFAKKKLKYAFLSKDLMFNISNLKKMAFDGDKTVT